MRALLIGLLLIVGCTSITIAQNITAAEYFFDSDPGVGNGTSLSITAAENVNSTYSIPTAGVGAGFHILMLRFKDANGLWSHAEHKAFYVETAAGAQTVLANIVAYEYFFNEDPGVGQGNGIPTKFGTKIIRPLCLNFLLISFPFLGEKYTPEMNVIF